MVNTLGKIRDGLGKMPRELISEFMVDIMSCVKFKETLSISLEIKNNLAKISYKGNGFGLVELLKCDKNPVNGGYGKNIIVKCENISFNKSYLDTWSVPVRFENFYDSLITDSPIEVERWLNLLMESTCLSRVENSDVINLRRKPTGLPVG